MELFHHRFDISTFTVIQNLPQLLDSAMANARGAFRTSKNFNTGKAALVYSAIAVKRLTPLRKMLNLAIVTRIVVLIIVLMPVAVGTFPLVLE